VRGRDLPGELIGKINLGDMAFLEVAGRLPTPPESIVFNACLVTLVEHGITPSALAARLTYAGAPESLQAAVAAGLCGLGTVFVGSMEGAARMLYAALPRARARAATDAELDEIARNVVADYRVRSTSRSTRARRGSSSSPARTAWRAATSA
jgi:citrate synthase